MPVFGLLVLLEPASYIRSGLLGRRKKASGDENACTPMVTNGLEAFRFAFNLPVSSACHERPLVSLRQAGAMLNVVDLEADGIGCPSGGAVRSFVLATPEIEQTMFLSPVSTTTQFPSIQTQGTCSVKRMARMGRCKRFRDVVAPVSNRASVTHFQETIRGVRRLNQMTSHSIAYNSTT